MQTINDVILKLHQITHEAQEDFDPLGYFAALYLKVTIKVKEGIENGVFEDPERMEQLDVIFAQRYLNALDLYLNNKPTTKSWDIAFRKVDSYWITVFQHLLLGMNAHINLDLGIATAEVGKQNMANLKNDFYKINEVLSSLVIGVEKDMTEIWPTLRFILKITGRADDFLIDFSLKKARDGAWKFANELSKKQASEKEKFIQDRDKIISRKAKLIFAPGLLTRMIFVWVRLTERGSIKTKVRYLLN